MWSALLVDTDITDICVQTMLCSKNFYGDICVTQKNLLKWAMKMLTSFADYMLLTIIIQFFVYFIVLHFTGLLRINAQTNIGLSYKKH